MSFRKFIILVAAGTIFSALSWLALIYFTEPSANFWQMTLFFLALFLSLAGVIFLISLFFRIKSGHDSFYFNYIKITVRQAILFSYSASQCRLRRRFYRNFRKPCLLKALTRQAKIVFCRTIFFLQRRLSRLFS